VASQRLPRLRADEMLLSLLPWKVHRLQRCKQNFRIEFASKAGQVSIALLRRERAQLIPDRFPFEKADDVAFVRCFRLQLASSYLLMAARFDQGGAAMFTL
jgi:hypothetical protein